MNVRGLNVPTFGPKYMRLSGYAKLQVQRYMMAQAAQKAAANNAAFSASMFGAKISQAQGLTELAIQAATQRTANEANARREALVKSLDVSA